jgi:deoxyribodipyrimidine photolyase-related protein
MSDYCGACAYDEGQGGRAGVPFNLLYWDFIARHRDRLARNPRMGPMVRTWDRFAPERQAQLRGDAQAFLDGLS